MRPCAPCNWRRRPGPDACTRRAGCASSPPTRTAPSTSCATSTSPTTRLRTTNKAAAAAHLHLRLPANADLCNGLSPPPHLPTSLDAPSRRKAGTWWSQAGSGAGWHASVRAPAPVPAPVSAPVPAPSGAKVQSGACWWDHWCVQVCKKDWPGKARIKISRQGRSELRWVMINSQELLQEPCSQKKTIRSFLTSGRVRQGVTFPLLVLGA